MGCVACRHSCVAFSKDGTFTYSLLHLECHFFNLQSQSMISFSRSLLPCSVEKRPGRLRLEIEIK